MSGNFFDSNVILYLTSSDDTVAIRAEDVLRSGGTISVQVLNECANVLRKKNKLDWPDIRIFLEQIRQRLEVVPVSVETHQTGLRLAERYGFSIYDSFIVAAALQADCDTLWSEDMQDGQLIESRLRIVNPFKAA